MVAPEEVADRLAIQELIARYSDAIDHRNWDALDRIFTDDAAIDYTEMGGISGGVSDVKRYLAETFAMFASTEHLMGLPVIEIDGDRAKAVTPCHNPLVLGAKGVDDFDPNLLVCGLWYHETFVRTPDGWRISALREERSYIKSFPRTTPDVGSDKET